MHPKNQNNLLLHDCTGRIRLFHVACTRILMFVLDHCGDSLITRRRIVLFIFDDIQTPLVFDN